MPSTGTPSSNTAAGARGGSAAVTDSGPPERITPRGRKARTCASPMSQGWISQYTPSSRTRRAMSCVYCAPKSRIRMRCAWMSRCDAVLGGALAAARGTLAIGTASGHPVVGCLLGDADIVHVTLAHPGARDAHEHGAGAHVGDVATAGVAHGRPQAAGELMQDGHDASLVGHAALDAFGHELLELGRGVLEVPVRRAVPLRHGAERAHAAIGLVGGALVELYLAGRFLGAGEQSADHHRVRTGGDRLGDVAREADATVGDHRHVGVLESR